ncbi:MAG: PQQ-dependent sugar dehydrogenase [Bacteroidetes bacterium]|nr:PQQ-dependent sugar dehydrogenase [Bacteroidota bacterium]
MNSRLFFSLILINLFMLCFIGMQSHPLPYLKDTDSSKSAGLELPKGFSAQLIAQGMDGARHIAITKQGGIYVKLSRLKNGKGIYYLKDNNGDGIIDQQIGFGDYPGTGIFIKGAYLYASSNEDVYRYKLNKQGEVIQPEKPEKIITGLVNRNRDNSKSIAVDDNGHIYVNIGSYSNSCLLDPKSKKAPNPCPLLDSVGGIWMFKTDKLNQHYRDGIRYATGFKNIVGLDWNRFTHSLFIMQHGRDLLHDLYPEYYTQEDNNNQPAETMYELHKNSNGGWPYVYYDQIKHQKKLAPEYGGDGKKTSNLPAQNPLVAFPAHLAPNGLLFYSGKQFPAKYAHGAFIAFHGKSETLQKGYLLAFVPFNQNHPKGKWEIFANKFTEGKNLHRPCGLAEGPDGSLYVTDDINGNIYRINYKK